MRTLLVVLLLAACRDKAPPPAQKPAAVDPWAAKDAGPKQTREELAAAAVARVGDIVPKLAKLRHLDVLHPIPAEYQTKDAFRAFVHKEIEKEGPHAHDQETALVQLGLLPAGKDLAKAEEDAFSSQAAAYYDPAQKKFFIVMVPDAPAILDMTSAHELTHGLQDQHFDLKKYLEEDDHGVSKLDDDQQAARRFIVEGDATFTMFLYTAGDMTGLSEPTPKLVNMLRDQLESMSDTDAMFAAMMQPGAMAGMGGSNDIEEATRAMKEIPRAILVPMIDSYIKGALVSVYAYQQGGWNAIDDLYKNPPESTEQVLHPKERLLKTRDRPLKVTLPKLPGYDEVMTNVLGELMWQVYFEQWKHSGDNLVARNWGGDRYALERGKDGNVMVILATAWDTEADAMQFAETYKSTIAARNAAPGHVGPIAVKLDGKNVFIVDGSDAPAVMDALVKGAKIAP